MIRRTLAAALAAACTLAPPATADTRSPAVLPLRQRADVMDRLLAERLDTLVPALMRREGIDMWILVAREYNEDPVVATMLPATWLAARRRTALMFFDRGEDAGVERMAVARYAVGDAFPAAWDPGTQPDQWARIAELVRERSPRSIALNTSPTFALADGLSHSERDALLEALGPDLARRAVSGERLAIGWLETRTPGEMALYPMIQRIAREIIHEGLSDRVIQPGVTTTTDVQWWYRERIAELKLGAWFHPSVAVQRRQRGDAFLDLFSGRDEVIRHGDLLHVDLGITYLALNTDTQQMAYVLHPGETDAPEGLRRAFTLGNRMQDILTNECKAGRTGNEILAASLAQARREGLTATVYTHPLGLHGHAAGPTIGMWDNQQGVPGAGDYELFPNTAYAIELNVQVEIPEWDGQAVRIMLEEGAFFDGESVRCLDGRQTSLLLIPR